MLIHHLAYIVDKIDLVCLERSEIGLIDGAQSSWHRGLPLQELCQSEAATRRFENSIRALRSIEYWGEKPLGCTLYLRNRRGKLCNVVAQRNAILSQVNVHNWHVKSVKSNQAWSVRDANPMNVRTSCGRPLDANGFCQRCLESFFDLEAYEDTHVEGVPNSPTTTIPTVELISASLSHRQ